MEIKRVEDIMIPLDKYPHIPYWFSLRQAMAIMEKSELEINGRKSLPRAVLVFNEKYQLMGFIGRRDLLTGLAPEFLVPSSGDYKKEPFEVKVDPNLAEFSYDYILKRIREQAEQQVSRVMHPLNKTVESSDNILKAIHEMVENDMSLLPVMNDGKVVGVVRSVDVFHEIALLVL